MMKAYKAARELGESGKALVNEALRGAAEVPLGVAERAAEVGRIAGELRGVSSPMMASDLTTAIALAGAAVTGALANVEINLGSIEGGSAEDLVFVGEGRKRAAELGNLS